MMDCDDGTFGDDDNNLDIDLVSKDYGEYVHSYGANSKEHYLAACKECRVIPATYYIRNMKNMRLNMAHHGLGVNGVKALALSLMANTHLIAVNLADNAISNEGAHYISQMLKENIFIIEIDLSNNKINEEGIQYICETLQLTDQLRKLSLKENNLTVQSAILLANTIQVNQGLRYLNLSHNSFGEEAAKYLAPAIAANDYIEEIDLSWNKIRQKGALAIAKSLKENITLKKLDLSWNGFGDDGVFVISDSLKVNGSLQELNLSSNRVTHVGALHLQKALQVNEGLMVLKLSQNPLQHGCTNILQGIKSNLNSTLTELDLSGVQVNQNFIDLLNQIKDESKDLTIYHGGLGGKAGVPLDRPKPIKVLKDYIKNNQLRIFDFFKSLDKDKSMSISIMEFVNGLKEQGVPLRKDELFNLVSSLDLDGDGEIDYRLGTAVEEKV